MKLIRLFKLKLRRKFENFIRKQYQKIRRGTNFTKEAYFVNVKKGKVRYTLFIVETYDGRKLRFNLGRHFVRDCKIQELSINGRNR